MLGTGGKRKGFSLMLKESLIVRIPRSQRLHKSIVALLAVLFISVLAVPAEAASNNPADELATLSILSEHKPNYDGKEWAWDDGLVLGDGCDTDCEVRAESVRGDGTWYSPFDGFVSNDHRLFEVDHLVSANEAHRSGGWQWSLERKTAFYNDRSTNELRVVSRKIGDSKSHLGPSTDQLRLWMPDFGDAIKCGFVKDWIHIKTVWGLAADAAEAEALTQFVADCGWVQGAGDATEFEDLFVTRPLHQGHSVILRLYWAVLGREPELGGAAYWVGIYDSEAATTLEIAAFFATSAEFQATYGSSLSNEEFVTVVYRNVLGREPDAGGYAYWVDLVNKGLGRDEMILYVSVAPEFVNSHGLPSDESPNTGPLG